MPFVCLAFLSLAPQGKHRLCCPCGAELTSRLLPDYHRYHSPVEGIVGKPTRIEGQYYTVNPQAIRTSLDVYGENVREVWPIHSPQFGTVMTVWIGAMSKRVNGSVFDKHKKFRLAFLSSSGR